MKTEIITFTTKGQIVIPAAIRRRLGIEEGTRATVKEEGGNIVIHPVTEAYVKSLRGSLKSLGLDAAAAKSTHGEGGSHGR